MLAVAFDRSAIDTEAPSGLGLWDALLDRLDDLLSEVNRVRTHTVALPGAASSQPAVTSRFESRSGLHFANPYLVDWAHACALEKDETAQGLRDLLAAEILASMNDDHSFGLFDVPTSSVFAILSLAALRRRGRTLRIAQLRLLDFVDPDVTFPPGTPFYYKHDAKAT